MTVPRPRAQRRRLWLLAATLGAATWCHQGAAGGAITVRAVVEKQEVYVGEAFVFQIQVSGSDDVQEPDLSKLEGFQVQRLGGQQNNSESITIVNRDFRRVVHKGYIISFRLTPTRAGQLAIPAVEVSVDGEKHSTQPVIVQAREPQETDDLKLRLTLSRTTCYVGEPVILTVTWYLRKQVRGFQFTLPVLEDPAFRSEDPEPVSGRPREALRIPLGSGEAIGQQEESTLDGQRCLAVSFRKALIPQREGTFQVPRATVACEVLTGYRRSRDPFDGMFDDFFAERRGVYEKMVIPSNALALEVKPLPASGRPPGFAGHVGEYRIESSATPTEVNVGDPITLTVRVSGPEFLRSVELPPLQNQSALARDFKIPAERAEGAVQGAAKVFTQTIRAAHSGVKEIPPIELPYFDTRAGEYRVARSGPIPLTVRATRIVTATDAEGRETPTVQTELQALQDGIAANYADLSVLESQDYSLVTLARSPVWVGIIAAPPLAYLALFVVVTLVRRRRADPAAIAARRAMGHLARTLKPLRGTKATDPGTCDTVLEALRSYLGAKLRVPPAALTYRDVESPLRHAGVAKETLEAVRGLFERCEAGRYAGTVSSSDAPADIALELARRLEASLE